jgi:hypothetical protein
MCSSFGKQMTLSVPRSYAVALALPWIIYLGFVIVTVVGENSPLRGTAQISWMTRGQMPLYLFIFIGCVYLVCRVWLGTLLEWPIFQRIGGLIGLAIIEAGVVFVVFLFWAVGMIGGPINPG